MPDPLRAKIAQRLTDSMIEQLYEAAEWAVECAPKDAVQPLKNAAWCAGFRDALLAIFLPLVEQAIREEREKHDKACEQLGAAWKELAEKDAQIAQLRAELARAVDALTQDYDTRLALKARIALDVLRLHEAPANREGTDGR